MDESLYFSSKIKNMGFLGEIRKLLFGVQSVSKSGAEKVAVKAEEIGEDILEKGAETLSKGKEIAGDVVGKAGAKLGDLSESMGDKLADLKDKAKGILDDAGNSESAQKAGDFTEKVGKKVMEVGGEAAEKAADLSEKVGEKVLDAKDKIMEKASEIGEKLSDKYDETYEKAKALEAQEALEPKGEFADTPLDAGGSLLEGSDDFFAKAEKYAEGEYSDKSTMKVGDTEIKLPEPDSQKELGKVAGMVDGDGDGNELVDDAIIIEDSTDDVMALEAPDAPEVVDVQAAKGFDEVPMITNVEVNVEEKAIDAKDSIQDKLSEIASETKAAAGDMASQANDTIKDVTSQKLSEMEDMMDSMGEEE